MSILGWLIICMYALASVAHIIMWMRERAYRKYMLAPKHRSRPQKVKVT